MINVKCSVGVVILAREMLKKYPKRTNVYLIDEELWAWAQYRAKLLGYRSVSEYLFELIKLDKQKGILKKA